MTAAERLAAALESIDSPDHILWRPVHDYTRLDPDGHAASLTALGFSSAILAADPTLAADIADGEALRRLREAGAKFVHIGDGWVSVETFATGGYRTGYVIEHAPTIAAAADAAREALR